MSRQHGARRSTGATDKERLRMNGRQYKSVDQVLPVSTTRRPVERHSSKGNTCSPQRSPWQCGHRAPLCRSGHELYVLILPTRYAGVVDCAWLTLQLVPKTAPYAQYVLTHWASARPHPLMNFPDVSPHVDCLHMLPACHGVLISQLAIACVIAETAETITIN